VRELGIGFVAYSPLGRGFLSAQIRGAEDLEDGDFRINNPRFQEGNIERNVELVDRVAEIAAEKKVTPAQLALAWVLAQDDDIAPIPGTTSVSHLEQNLAALEIELGEEDLARIEQAFPRGATSGERYPDMSQVNR